MSEDPRRLVGRIIDGCFGLLLAALALYAAVAIVKSLWIWLCIAAGCCIGAVVAWRLLVDRFGRW